jgi:CHAD domain-containing protein
MPYRLLPGEAVAEGLRRIVVEQIDRALAEIDDESLDRHASVHQVRKRCKKVRAVLRLARGTLGGAIYRRENARYRNAAKPLSCLRDAEAHLETYDMLTGGLDEEVDRRAFGPIRLILAERRARLADGEDDLDARLARFAGTLRDGRAAVADWPLRDKGFALVGEGFAKTYKRGRKARREVLDGPDPETVHEWRKRVKYHWYHCRLLRRAWPAMMQVRAAEIKRLADLLGDDHDLAVLSATLERERELFAGVESLGRFRTEMARRSKTLRRKARPLGRRVYAEKTRHLLRRIEVCWKA